MKYFFETLRTVRNWALMEFRGSGGNVFSSVHVFPCEAFNQFFVGDMELPVWFPVGRTLLIPKGGVASLCDVPPVW